MNAFELAIKQAADEKFEADVIYQLEIQGELTTSDAQGILEVHDFLFMQLLCTDKNAAQVATEILNKSRS